MRVGDLVKHRDIGATGILIKRNTESPNERHQPWRVLLQGYSGRLVTWFSSSIEVISEGR